MSALTPVERLWRGSRKASPDRVRAIEKPSKNGGQAHQGDPGPREGLKPPPRLQIELVCQSETHTHDPFWDGPRLTPIFVTQVLGQVMAPERTKLVRTPYGKPEDHGATARLLDETL